jgi:energy-coupling factor transport system ATP-binding protein
MQMNISRNRRKLNLKSYLLCRISRKKLSHVRVEDLCYRHEDGSEVFENLNLEIKHRRVSCPSGHNGAGKTTLAGHLIGFYRPASGRVFLNEKI